MRYVRSLSTSADDSCRARRAYQTRWAACDMRHGRVAAFGDSRNQAQWLVRCDTDARRLEFWLILGPSDTIWGPIAMCMCRVLRKFGPPPRVTPRNVSAPRWLHTVEL